MPMSIFSLAQMPIHKSDVYVKGIREMVFQDFVCVSLCARARVCVFFLTFISEVV